MFSILGTHRFAHVRQNDMCAHVNVNCHCYQCPYGQCTMHVPYVLCVMQPWSFALSRLLMRHAAMTKTLTRNCHCYSQHFWVWWYSMARHAQRQLFYACNQEQIPHHTRLHHTIIFAFLSLGPNRGVNRHCNRAVIDLFRLLPLQFHLWNSIHRSSLHDGDTGESWGECSMTVFCSAENG